MAYMDRKDSIDTFEVMDVRNLQGNFFPQLIERAKNLEQGHGITIIQTFEPHPLYAQMESLGFKHHTTKVGSTEFHAHFYRKHAKQSDNTQPFRPLALLNFPMIDEELGKIAVDFWNITWNDENRTLPQETRLLLSMANAVGAGRMRQATRELIKVYANGIDSNALDDVFELFAWNQGIGYFASEIGPSSLFKAYKLIKTYEKKGMARNDVISLLMEKFGEGNPETSVL